MSEYDAGFDFVVNPDIKAINDFKKVLRKLKIMQNDPLQELMDALSAGSGYAAANFGAPSQAVVSPNMLAALKKFNRDDDNLKP